MLNHSPLGVFLLLPWLMVSCNYSPDSVLGSVEPQIPSIGDAEPLGPEGRASLHAILETGKLPDLRWPDFSDYREDVAKFYETHGDALPWVRGMQAIPQAQAMIEVLQSAGEKGLFFDDYGGSRWAGRLTRIKPASRDPKELDLVGFDVALTLSAMRYISDLHIGRVNPKRLHFAVDVAERGYNSAEFVVPASSVATTLQQIEPGYPGHQRMIRALGRYREIARQDHGETLPVSLPSLVSVELSAQDFNGDCSPRRHYRMHCKKGGPS